MKLKEAKEQKKTESIDFPIKFEKKDIEEELRNVMEKIKRNADKKGMTTFSFLSKLFNPDDVLISLFVPLLYLMHRGKVILLQEQFFGEIIIALADQDGRE